MSEREKESDGGRKEGGKGVSDRSRKRKNKENVFVRESKRDRESE